MNITKKLTMLTYTGSFVTLSTSDFKNNINVIYSINSGGNGYVSFSSSSNFNSLLALNNGVAYLIDSKTESLPWNLSTGSASTTTAAPTTTTASPTTTTASPTTTTASPTTTTASPTTTTASPTTTTASPTTTTASPTTTTASPTTTTTVAPGIYSMYATQSNSDPAQVSANSDNGNGSAGQTGNFANYGSSASWNGAIGNVTSVGTNGSGSFFGTFDQSGNIWEWNDSVIQSTNRGILGGSYSTSITSDLSSVSRRFASPSSGIVNYGFRVCCKYPIPSGNSLIEFVPVLNPNNPANSTGYGAVNYAYSISKYPITNEQYAQFLLSIGATDTYGVYSTNMGTNIRGGINSNYTVKNNMGNKPVNYITWFRAARFVNWLQNGMPSGNQSSLTTESGTYLLNGANSGVAFNKNPNANYWIPSEDEWYKAAFYRTL